MEPETIHDIVRVALSHADLNLILYLWAPTAWQEEQGLITREIINEYVPYFAQKFDIIAEDSSSFPEFMKEYDRQTYEKCALVNNDCVTYFARQGNLRAFKTAVAKEGMVSLDAITEATKEGHLDIIQYIEEKCKISIPWKNVLNAAVQGDQVALVIYSINRLSIKSKLFYWYSLMSDAVKTGSLRVLKYLIDYAQRYDTFEDDTLMFTLSTAIEYKQLGIIEYLLSTLNKPLADYETASEPNQPLYAAARGGNKDVMQLLIDHGADNWDVGLRGAIKEENKDLIAFFIRKGAYDWQKALIKAADIGNRELVVFFIGKGAVPTIGIVRQFNLN